MDENARDDSPPEFRLTRRQIVVGGGLVLGGGIAWIDSAGGAADDAMSPFMQLSSLLIQHHLDPSVGARLDAALTAQDSTFPSRVEALLAIAQGKGFQTVEAFFPHLPEGALKAQALAIISAWYLGVVADVPGSEVLAFELALLYQPTRDVMTIPSYAISGPNGWNDKAPLISDLPVF